MAGALAAKITTDGSQVLVLRANSENQMIAAAATGFCDGYRSRGGGQPTDLSLSEVSGQGFTNAEDIYKLCELGTFDCYRFLYPLIGGSINGLFQYFTETLNLDQLWVAGVDNDKSQFALIVPFSLLKNIDVAIESYILDWVNKVPMPRHQRFGLRSGHTEFLKGLWQDYDSQYLDDLKAEAMRLEDQFEDSNL